MLVPGLVYWVSSILFAVAIVAVFTKYVRFFKPPYPLYMGLVVACCFGLATIYFFPYVYRVKECGAATVSVLILPLTSPDGTQLDHGWGAYLINETDRKLRVSSHFYGDRQDIRDLKSQGSDIENVQAPHSTERYDTEKFHLYFEAVPNSISTRGGGASVRYLVDCI